MCTEGKEEVVHLFPHCTWTKEVWLAVKDCIGVQFQRGTMETIQMVARKHRSTVKINLSTGTGQFIPAPTQEVSDNSETKVTTDDQVVQKSSLTSNEKEKSVVEMASVVQNEATKLSYASMVSHTFETCYITVKGREVYIRYNRRNKGHGERANSPSHRGRFHNSGSESRSRPQNSDGHKGKGMDQFIGTATGVGLGLVVVQLILYFIYCLNKITFAADESIWMGKWHNNNVKTYHDGKQSNFHEHNQHSNQPELVAVSNLTKKNDKS
ncbi:hypothetical protein BC332_27537 [Capsicum chinense]|nr:hypothetical protein BC332_27537 [Capsicum chinense]